MWILFQSSSLIKIHFILKLDQPWLAAVTSPPCVSNTCWQASHSKSMTLHVTIISDTSGMWTSDTPQENEYLTSKHLCRMTWNKSRLRKSCEVVSELSPPFSVPVWQKLSINEDIWPYQGDDTSSPVLYLSNSKNRKVHGNSQHNWESEIFSFKIFPFSFHKSLHLKNRSGRVFLRTAALTPG